MAATWQRVGELQRRDYVTYGAYLAHQGAKLDRMAPGALVTHEARYLAAVQPRLLADGLAPGTAVLCLGARGGAEVRAFRSLGARALGIDVHPGHAEVLPGDFHALPFQAQTFGAVFTNALDHCYDVDQVLAEVRRVLIAAGHFIVEAVRGTREGCAPGSYESLAWPTIDTLIQALTARGFRLVQRGPAFTCPWPGEHLVFRLAAV